MTEKAFMLDKKDRIVYFKPPPLSAEKRQFIAPLGSNLGQANQPRKRKRKRSFDGKEYNLIGLTRFRAGHSRSDTELGLGKNFQKQLDFQHKSAKNLVKKLNENGWNARVVRWTNQSGVYVRPKYTPNINYPDDAILRGQKIAPVMKEYFTGKDKSNMAIWPRWSEAVSNNKKSKLLGNRRANLAERPIIFHRKLSEVRSYDSKPKGTQCAGCGSKSKSRCRCDLGKDASPMIDYDSITPEMEKEAREKFVMQYVDEMSDDRSHGNEYLAFAALKVQGEIENGKIAKDMTIVKQKIAEYMAEYEDETREYNKKIKIYHGTDRKFNEFDDNFLVGSSVWFTTDRDLAMKGYSGARGKGIVVEREFEESELNLATPEDEDKYLRMQLDAMGYDGIKYPSAGNERYFVNSKGQKQLSWGSADDVYEIWNYDKLKKPKVGGRSQ